MKHPYSVHISRRSFVSRMAAFAAATGVPLWYLERQSAFAAEAPRAIISPNARPGLALVGCGGWDRRCTQFIAIRRLRGRMRRGQSPHGPGDHQAETGRQDPACQNQRFRDLLTRDDIDVIINGTPDHWHTLINIGAATSKKHIYSEKPLTLTIDEGRQVVKAVRQNAVTLQTGTQQRAARFRLACELVRNGRIGKLKEVNVWLPAGDAAARLPRHPFRQSWTGTSGRGRPKPTTTPGALPQEFQELVGVFRRYHDRLGSPSHGHRVLGHWPESTAKNFRYAHDTTHPRRIHHLQRV